MSFYIFNKYDFISSIEMNANFRWIADGSYLPRGGDGLKPTDGVYDIGSASDIWDTLYCSELNFDTTITSGNQLYRVIAETLIDTTANSSRTGLFAIVLGAK